MDAGNKTLPRGCCVLSWQDTASFQETCTSAQRACGKYWLRLYSLCFPSCVLKLSLSGQSHDLGSHGQPNGLFLYLILKCNQVVVDFLWWLWQCANSFYGWLDLNVPLLAEPFTPFSHAKIENIYLGRDFAVAVSCDSPFHFPKSLLLHCK